MQDHDERNPTLTAALQALSRADAALVGAPEVESRLLAEVRSIARRRRRTRIAAAGLLAASLAAVAIVTWRAGGPAPDATLAGGAAPSTQPTEVVTPFFPLAYAGVPAAEAQIVRVELPRTALAAVGLTPGETVRGSAIGTVQADVLVGEDGLARAIRFVSTREEVRP